MSEFVCGHCFVDFGDKTALIEHHKKVVKKSEQRKAARMRKKLLLDESLIDVKSFIRRIKLNPLRQGTTEEQMLDQIKWAMKEGAPTDVSFTVEHENITSVEIKFSLYMPERKS